MEDINVKFLGEKYVLPKELPNFLKIWRKFDGYKNQLFKKLNDQIKDKKWCSGADVDFVYWKEPIENIAIDIIENFSDKEIYDITVTELVEENQGYKDLRSICAETLEKFKHYAINIMDNWIDGYESAYATSSSQIVGSGVSLWTDSFSSALLYTALEGREVKKQCEQADRDFRSAIESLNRKTNDRLENEKNNLLLNFYYPGCFKSIEAIVGYMFSIYLMKSGMADEVFDKVEKYSTNRSRELLKNLEIIDNKKRVLKSAFEACPYDFSIYEKLIDLDMIDFDTFSIAKKLDFSNEILDDIISFCEKNKKDFKCIETAVEIWAYFEEKEIIEIYRQVYSEVIDKALEEYNMVDKAIKQEDECIRWIKKHITSNAYMLVEKNERDLKSLVKIELEKIIDKNTFEKLNEMGLLHELKERLQTVDNIKYDEIIQKKESKLLGQIFGIIHKLSLRNERITKEAECRKEEIKRKKIELEEYNKNSKKEIDELFSLKKECKLFELKKKKNLKERIEGREKEQRTNARNKKFELEKIADDYDLLIESLTVIPDVI